MFAQQFGRSRQHRVPTGTVIAHYQGLSPGGDKDLMGLFQRVNVWHETVFVASMAWDAQVYYSTDLPPDHPDRLLTLNGEETRLAKVARNYLALRRSGRLPDHPYVRNVRYFVEQLRAGVALPHVILVTGRVRSKVYIIDGNTRSLAAAVYGIETGEPFPYLRAYLGRPELLSPLNLVPGQVLLAIRLLADEGGAPAR